MSGDGQMATTTPQGAVAYSWTDEDVLEVGGVDFNVRAMQKPKITAKTDLLHVLKPRPMVEAYLDYLPAVRPRHVLELGIFHGGSVALMMQLTRPEKLVALDISEKPAGRLERYVTEFRHQDRLHTHYGVDQRDSATLRGIVESEFGDDPPDLIIDDASHLLQHSRTSFDTLFPRLAPGGLYIIEDWPWGLFRYSKPAESKSLSILIYELLLAVPYSPHLISEVSVNQFWAAIRKTPEATMPDPWHLGMAYSGYGRQIVAGAEAAAEPPASSENQ